MVTELPFFVQPTMQRYESDSAIFAMRAFAGRVPSGNSASPRHDKRPKAAQANDIGGTKGRAENATKRCRGSSGLNLFNSTVRGV